MALICRVLISLRSKNWSQLHANWDTSLLILVILERINVLSGLFFFLLSFHLPYLFHFLCVFQQYLIRRIFSSFCSAFYVSQIGIFQQHTSMEPFHQSQPKQQNNSSNQCFILIFYSWSHDHSVSMPSLVFFILTILPLFA